MRIPSGYIWDILKHSQRFIHPLPTSRYLPHQVATNLSQNISPHANISTSPTLCLHNCECVQKSRSKAVMMWGAKDEQYPLLALSLLYEQTHNIHAKETKK